MSTYPRARRPDAGGLRWAPWKHVTAGGETDDLYVPDPGTVTLPPGAPWTLRGYLGEPSPVGEPLNPGSVRLLSTPDGALMTEQDPRRVIPLG
ncbi:hypothetical protein QQY24_27865 [Streptomyces sp. TG1A-8]|uniref:hypothetical protein n=1 Tax=Streptomyces sp. TG1A-8 TaxID=3051385 RepID=UPI00265BCE59|nr:hypothetical protein [Streptomyces sp. TG1A-8]MDO0929039.1 hypothetical protein [Streptomyces sp. TG1A-8]